VSDPEPKDLDSSVHAPLPPWPSETSNAPDQISLGRANDKRGWPVQHKPDRTVLHLRPVEGQDSQVRKQSDLFADALAKVMQEQLEPKLVETPSVLRNRQSLRVAAGFAIAGGSAALVALVFVVALSPMSAVPTWQSLKSSLFPALERTTAPTLFVRGGSGPVNEPLSLGVNVSSPSPGAAVTIGRIPATASLTVGKRMSNSEWRVPAQEISDASIIPPVDFVGVMDLTAELRGSDEEALVSRVVRLTWTPAMPDATTGLSVNAPTVHSSGPAAPTPQQQQAVASPGPSAAARAEPPMRKINPDEVASFVKRAQELLVTGDLQAARFLLLRAAEAHDARAALYLAKTFDPIVSKQLGEGDLKPDLAQARKWYQKAEEWGAPEARRQLDALASYPP
jgi:hypothetical protein